MYLKSLTNEWPKIITVVQAGDHKCGHYFLCTFVMLIQNKVSYQCVVFLSPLIPLRHISVTYKIIHVLLILKSFVGLIRELLVRKKKERSDTSYWFNLKHKCLILSFICIVIAIPIWKRHNMLTRMIKIWEDNLFSLKPLRHIQNCSKEKWVIS